MPSQAAQAAEKGTMGERCAKKRQSGTVYQPATLDNKMCIQVGSDVTRKGNTMTIPYTLYGNNASAVNRISVLVLDEQWKSGNTNEVEALDYAVLTVDAVSANGTGTYTFPDELAEELVGKRISVDYFVYLVPEHVSNEVPEYAGNPAPVIWAALAEKRISIGTESIIDPCVCLDQLSVSWKGVSVYYGTWDSNHDDVVEPMKYRVLDASTTDYSADGKTETMLLDCDEILDCARFDADPFQETWGSSELYSLLNGNAFLNNPSVLTKAESNAIASSTKASHALTTNSATGVNVSSQTQKEYGLSAALTGEKIFLLDVEEISNILFGYPSDNSWWRATRKKTNPASNLSCYYFLRSLPLTNSSELVGCVDDLGNITSQYKTPAYGICPAFNLKRSEVLFSSVAEDSDLFDKSLSLNAGSSEVAVSTGLTRKLTLLDKRKSVALASGRSVTAAEDGTITIPYAYTDTSGTQWEKVNQLSVMITDKPYSAENTAHAQILYYGALENIKDQDGNSGTAASTKTGTGEFVLPTALQGKDYHIYLIAEHVSADVKSTTKVDERYYSDYAGEPLEFTIVKKLSEAELPQLEAPTPEQPFQTVLASTVTGVAVSVSWENAGEAAGQKAAWNTSYQAKLKLTPEKGYTFTDSFGNRIDVFMAGNKLTDDKLTWNEDGSVIVDAGSYTTTVRKIISVEAPKVAEQFAANYTERDVLQADELKATAKVTLEGTMAPDSCEMEVEWSIVDADGNPAVYDAASGAENRYQWVVKASEYTSYDVNGVSLTGTVVIKNRTGSGSVVYPVLIVTPKPKETPKPIETPSSVVPSEPTETPKPTEAPTASPVAPKPTKTPDTSKNTSSSAVTVGKMYKDGSGKGWYRVTGAKKNRRTVTYVKPVNKKVKKVIIPAKIKLHGVTYRVTAIGEKAFIKCKKLQRVTIGKNVIKIGKKAFYKQKKLIKLTVLTKRLTKKRVGAEAFAITSESLVVQVPKGRGKLYRKLFKKRGMRPTAVINVKKNQ